MMWRQLEAYVPKAELWLTKDELRMDNKPSVKLQHLGQTQKVFEALGQKDAWYLPSDNIQEGTSC